MRKNITIILVGLFCLFLVSCSAEAAGAQDGEGMDTIPLHEVHVFGDWQSTVAPTCAEAGAEGRTCTVCGYMETRFVDAVEHSFGDWSATMEVTCTESGMSVRSCSACGALDNQVISATGHSFGEWTTTSAPLCETAGTEAQSCQRCGATVTRELSPTGHPWEETWTETLTATCEEKGIMTLYCQCCEKTKMRETRPTGHELALTESKRATQAADGFEVYTCSRCRMTDRRVLPATGSIGVEFSCRSDGTCLVTGIGTFTGEELILPEYHEGYRVVGIADDAFSGCATVKKIVLSDTILTVGKNAFEECSSLQSILLGKGVTEIGESAFFACTSLKIVRGGESLLHIGSFAFWGCSSLESISLYANLETVDELAFHSCGVLSEVYFGGAALSDWLTVAIAPDNDPLLHATRFYYVEAQPEGEGNYWREHNGEITKW